MDPPVIGDIQKRRVRRGRKDILDHVFLTDTKTRDTATTAVLRLIRLLIDPLNVSPLSHGNNHFLFFDQILVFDFFPVDLDRGAPLIVIFPSDF